MHRLSLRHDRLCRQRSDPARARARIQSPTTLDEPTGSLGSLYAQAELRLLSVMGLQTFNSIRVLDWVSTLSDVDTSRIGITGASGGGTQTFMLTAVDDRPSAAFPAVMVSTAMQGGCTCENASYLRIGTGNVEIAALCAPRPLGMTAANDWTRELETKGLPELKKLYELLGAGKTLKESISLSRTTTICQPLDDV